MIDQHEQTIQSVILNTVEDRSHEIHTLMTEIAVNEQTDREAIFNATTGFNPFWFTKDILIEPVATPIARRKLKACFKQIDKDYELGYFDVDHSKTSKRPIGKLSGEIIAMEKIYRRLVATNPKLFGWANDPWKAESLLKPRVEEVQPKSFTFTEEELVVLLNASSAHSTHHRLERDRKQKEGKCGAFHTEKRKIASSLYERFRSEILRTTGDRIITAL